MLENGSTVIGQSVDELLLAVRAVCRAKQLTDLCPGHPTTARSSNRRRQRFLDCDRRAAGLSQRCRRIDRPVASLTNAKSRTSSDDPESRFRVHHVGLLA